MQREKLYNLHTTTNFTVVIFLFKSDKILSHQISMLQKRYLFSQTRNVFFSYFIFFLPDMFYLKKTKYTTRCSVKSSTIYIRTAYFTVAPFVSKIDKLLSG
jgi:hypothetical protein